MVPIGILSNFLALVLLTLLTGRLLSGFVALFSSNWFCQPGRKPVDLRRSENLAILMKRYAKRALALRAFVLFAIALPSLFGTPLWGLLLFIDLPVAVALGLAHPPGYSFTVKSALSMSLLATLGTIYWFVLAFLTAYIRSSVSVFAFSAAAGTGLPRQGSNKIFGIAGVTVVLGYFVAVTTIYPPGSFDYGAIILLFPFFKVSVPLSQTLGEMARSLGSTIAFLGGTAFEHSAVGAAGLLSEIAAFFSIRAAAVAFHISNFVGSPEKLAVLFGAICYGIIGYGEGRRLQGLFAERWGMRHRAGAS